MHIANVERGERSLAVTWADQTITEFPFIWLRENDHDAFHPDAGERILDLTTIDKDIRPEDVESDPAEIRVRWPAKPDVSAYACDWLFRHRPGHGRHDPAKVDQSLWDASSLKEVPAVSVADCTGSPAAMKSALLALKRAGLLVFNGLKDDSRAADDLGDRIGFRICEDLARDCPEDFELLSNIPIPWRFHDADWDIRQHRPVINLDANGNVAAFVFNAHIADLPDMRPDILHDFYPAYRRLMLRIRDPRYAIRYSLSPGEVVAFDNRRVLHGRTAFDPGSADRHLHGYYIEQNEIDSRIRVLSRLI